MKVYLVRHGETIENLSGIHQGQRVPGTLSEKGIIDAKKLQKTLKDEIFDVIYCSPLKRAYDTCKIILEPHNYSPEVIISNDVIAKDTGELGGKEKKFIFEEAERRKIPIAELKMGGENTIDVQNRISTFLSSLEKSNYKNVLVVTHGCTIVTYLLKYFGKDFDSYDKYQPSSTAVTMLVRDENTGKLRVESFNDTAHL